MGRVERIYIVHSPGDEGTAVRSVEALAGQGPTGDYHCEPHEPGSGRDVTLIEAEALEGLLEDTGIELAAAQSRRNVLTRGVDLNALVGERFFVGAVECIGRELCEPCRKLERWTQPGVLRGLVRRGGLRADVVNGGTIAVGDALRAA